VTSIYNDSRLYVVPGELSTQAQSFKVQQESLGRKVFIKAYEQLAAAKCLNCQDHSQIIITCCDSGPYQIVPDGRLAVWFEGDEKYALGWYAIHRAKTETIGPDGKTIIVHQGSQAFACPTCQEENPVRAEPEAWWSET